MHHPGNVMPRECEPLPIHCLTFAYEKGLARSATQIDARNLLWDGRAFVFVPVPYFEFAGEGAS
jgi:hypothetical protein